MDLTVDMADIAELATEVAINGAIASGTISGDELFEMLVGISAIIHG